MSGLDRTVAFLDLSRFTSLTDACGDDTAVEVLDRFVATVDDALAGQARRVKTLGDGALLTSDTPADGIAVAVRIITSFHDEHGMPDIAGGLHHGPVIERDGDVFGQTVNLASRLSDAAPAAGIYTTDTCARAASEAGLEVEPLGPLELRGVLDPVEAFAIVPCDHRGDTTVTDPVCGMRIAHGDATPQVEHGGRTIWFCAAHCEARFVADPDRYIDGGHR